MIENRPLTDNEINEILLNAPDSETKNLNRISDILNIDACTLLNRNAVYKFGLIINKRPVYFAHVIESIGKYHLWTIVNSDVKEQHSLFKYSKRETMKALKDFSPLYARMEKCNTVLFEIKRGK